MSGNLIKIGQEVDLQSRDNAIKGLNAGLLKGGTDFSGNFMNKVYTVMDMFASGIHKSDTEEGALRLSFSRYMNNARIVSNQFTPFINRVREVGDDLDLLQGYFPGFGSIPVEPDNSENQTMLEAYSIEGSDREKISFFKSRIIPMFNSKWKAVEASGNPNNPDEIFYSAIVDWTMYVTAMGQMSSQSQLRVNPARRNTGPAPDPAAPAPAPDPADISALVRLVTIDSVVPGSVAEISVDRGNLVIDRASVVPGNDLIVRLEIVGGDSAQINSASSSDVFLEMERRGLIGLNRASISGAGLDVLDVFDPRTSISGANSVSMDVVMREHSLRRLWAGTRDGDYNVMRINSPAGIITVDAADAGLRSRLLKLSDGGQTTPLYETVSPGGKSVTFTPAQLVAGGGRVRGRDGKLFKVKKWKGRSLADRVMSKEFGKVKTRKKKKK